MRRTAIIIALALAALVAAEGAVASTFFRCDGHRVEGLTRFDLERFCGPPASEDAYLAPVPDTPAAGVPRADWCRVIEVAYYVRQDNGRSYRLELEQGRVVRIEAGARPWARP